MIKKLLLPLSVVIFLSLLFFLPPRLIKISKIECRSQYGECPTELVSGIQYLVSGNLASAKKGVDKALSGYEYVSDYSTRFAFPSTLKVDILVKKALYALKAKDSENYSLVDRDGRVLALSSSSSLPTVVATGDIGKVGEVVTPKELFALKLIEGVFAMYQVGVGEIMSDSLVVELPSRKKVIFPLGDDKDKEVLLGSLRLIYSQVGDKEIDLRFKSPVLR